LPGARCAFLSVGSHLRFHLHSLGPSSSPHEWVFNSSAPCAYRKLLLDELPRYPPSGFLYAWIATIHIAKQHWRRFFSPRHTSSARAPNLRHARITTRGHQRLTLRRSYDCALHSNASLGLSCCASPVRPGIISCLGLRKDNFCCASFSLWVVSLIGTAGPPLITALTLPPATRILAPFLRQVSGICSTIHDILAGGSTVHCHSTSHAAHHPQLPFAAGYSHPLTDLPKRYNIHAALFGYGACLTARARSSSGAKAAA